MRLLSKNKLFLSSLVIIPIFFILFRTYLGRVGAFGCFDDCNNYMWGYFLSQGRTLFSEIFSGHMPLIGYISLFIQNFFSPDSIYQLLVYHKMFLLFFSLISSILLILRFRWAGLFFVLFYEPFKFYLFGDRFLAEGIIVYPIVYLAGLVWLKISSKKIFRWEYLLAGILTWFVVFMRQPYIPLAFFLYGFLLFGKNELKVKIYSILIFLVATLLILSAFPLRDFFLNVVTLNQTNVSSELSQTATSGVGIVKNFFYPLTVFFQGGWNLMRVILIAFSFSLIALFFLQIKNKKLLVLFVFLSLGLANLRFVEPGKIFYGSYHLLIWYGLLIMFVSLLLKDSALKYKKIFYPLLIILFLVGIFYPKNFIWEKVDTNAEISEGYANYYINGMVIKTLSDKDSTLFVDGGDDLIYWQAKLKPAYKYSWYTALMPYYKPFRDARFEMFRDYPPDFYYGNCRKGYFLPDFANSDYLNIKHTDGKKSCLYIKKEFLEKVNTSAVEEVKNLGFTVPKEAI